jgi:plasmid stabilization system protein ParE
LIGIADYVAVENPQRALSFIKEIKAKIGVLAEFPFMYPILSRYEKIGIRRGVHGNCLFSTLWEATR